jgi:outer membrane murein-binding lipoprotein Lpp
MRRLGPSLGRRLAAAVPALALGMAAGVTGGVWAASALDTTPYGQTELNTAARNGEQSGRDEGWAQAKTASDEIALRVKQTTDARVGRLESRLAKTRRALQAGKRSSARAQKEAGRREAELERSLAETTAALNNATSQISGAGSRRVEGTLRATWVLGRQDEPWPKDCSDALRTYNVRVTAGPDVTVARARLVKAGQTRRVEHKNTLTLTCALSYTAGLPTPLGSAYRFVVVDSSRPGSPAATESAPGLALQDGSGPPLSVTR